MSHCNINIEYALQAYLPGEIVFFWEICWKLDRRCGRVRCRSRWWHRVGRSTWRRRIRCCSWRRRIRCCTCCQGRRIRCCTWYWLHAGSIGSYVGIRGRIIRWWWWKSRRCGLMVEMIGKKRIIATEEPVHYVLQTNDHLRLGRRSLHRLSRVGSLM